MARKTTAASLRTQPLLEEWDALHEAFVTVLIEVAVRADGQALGFQAVQALTQCAAQLREIVAEFADDDDVEDE